MDDQRDGGDESAGDKRDAGDERDVNDEKVELDGSAGGGQLLRSALSLSIATGRPFEMENVRGARPEPGLRPQHLAAVRAAAQACDATVSGAEQGSESVAFHPGSLDGGRIEVDVGTAGSVTLLFDALLPVALALDAPLSVTARGGTDVKWSPTMAYYRQVKLPLLREWGVWAAVECPRSGFYPVGGGEATLRLAPASPPALDLTDRGSLEGVRIYSKASAELADEGDVATRQAESAVEMLDWASNELESAADADEVPDLEIRERTVSSVETASPGSALAVELDYEETTAGFDALGEKGKPSEEVGREAVSAALSFVGGWGERDYWEPRTWKPDDWEQDRGAVDTHMADQLVVFLALAGGRVTIPEVTDHVETGVELVSEFGRPVSISEGDPPTLTAERE